MGLWLSPPDPVLPKGWPGEQKPLGLEDNRLDVQDGSSQMPGKNRKAGAEVQVAVRAVALNSVPIFDRL